MSNGVCIPVTEEAAIAFFQGPIVGVLGASWYIWAYGEGVYFKADAYKEKELTLYQRLFITTNYSDFCEWDPNIFGFDKALFEAKAHSTLLYDFN